MKPVVWSPICILITHSVRISRGVIDLYYCSNYVLLSALQLIQRLSFIHFRFRFPAALEKHELLLNAFIVFIFLSTPHSATISQF